MVAFTSFVTLVVLSVISVPVRGWGTAGHEIVATIAQIHLDPNVFPAICDILNFTSTEPNTPLCHLAPVAAWADKVRFKMRWSSSLHYIGALGDHPSDACIFPGQRGWAGRKGANVLGAVKNVTGILEDWAGIKEGSASHMVHEDGPENEALKFLVHFMGDMHMPLHLTGRDRGGNSVKVRFDGRITSLHSVWDSLLISKGIRTVPSNYSRPLPFQKIESALRGGIYDPYVRRIMHEGVLGKWRDEIPEWLLCPAEPPLSQSSRGPWQEVMSSREMLDGVAGETDDEFVCPYHWAQPIHALNCELVWPKEIDEPPYGSKSYPPDSPEGCGVVDSQGRKPRDPHPYLELDTPEYWGVISDQWVVEKLLAMAGVRLAGVLNYLFADGSEKGLGAMVDL